MAGYLPPINSYPIFDSVSFMTSDLPISHEQATDLLCKAPVAQTDMIFTGNTTLMNKMTFNAAMVGTSNTNLTIQNNITCTGMMQPVYCNLTNTSSVLGSQDSGTIRFADTTAVGSATFNVNVVSSCGLTHTGTSGVWNSGTYTAPTNTPYSTVSPGDSGITTLITGTNVSCGNLNVTGTTADGVSILLGTSSTSFNVTGNLTANGTFNAPRLYLDSTTLTGKYPVMLCYGSYDWTYATLTATAGILYNCTFSYNSVTNIATVGLSGITGLNNYLVFYNVTGNPVPVTKMTFMRTISKGDTGFTFVAGVGSSVTVPASNQIINWVVYL